MGSRYVPSCGRLRRLSATIDRPNRSQHLEIDVHIAKELFGCTPAEFKDKTKWSKGHDLMENFTFKKTITDTRQSRLQKVAALIMMSENKLRTTHERSRSEPFGQPMASQPAPRPDTFDEALAERHADLLDSTVFDAPMDAA